MKTERTGKQSDSEEAILRSFVGVEVVPPCADTPGWYDADGSVYNCNWYSVGNRCARYGSGYRNFGQVANEACCACRASGRLLASDAVSIMECSFAVADSINENAIKTHLENSFNGPINLASRLSALAPTVTVSRCQPSTDPAQPKRIRLRCDISGADSDWVTRQEAEVKAALQAEVASKVFDVSVHVFDEEKIEDMRQLTIKLSLAEGLRSTLAGTFSPGALCNTFLGEKSAWDRLQENRADPYKVTVNSNMRDTRRRMRFASTNVIEELGWVNIRQDLLLRRSRPGQGPPGQSKGR